jgi:hypothetical protein
MSYHQLKGWLLTAAADLDSQCPGVAGHVLRSFDERRHVIAAVLSVTPREMYCLDLGRQIQTASHDELIELAFGMVPRGYRRALARAGLHIQPRRFYRYLWAIFSSDDRSEMARVAMSLKRVTWPRLKIMRALPADLRNPMLIDVISDPLQARDLGRVVSMLADHGADRDEMSQVLAGVRTQEHLSGFARRWSMKATFPAHPVPPSDFYTPINTGEELQTSARRFRNCSRSHVARILEGRSSFAEVRIEEGSAVVHLICEGRNWVLEDIYGPSNDRPANEVEDAAEKYLKQFGIGRSSPIVVDSPWASLRRLTGRFEFEF